MLDFVETILYWLVCLLFGVNKHKCKLDEIHVLQISNNVYIAFFQLETDTLISTFSHKHPTTSTSSKEKILSTYGCAPN